VDAEQDPGVLNRILWWDAKGYDTAYPAEGGHGAKR